MSTNHLIKPTLLSNPSLSPALHPSQAPPPAILARTTFPTPNHRLSPPNLGPQTRMYGHHLDPTISSPTTMVHSHYHFPTPQSLNATFVSPVHTYQPNHLIEPTPLSDTPHSPDRMNAPGAPPPRNLSALCSGTQNLWGTISHRHRCHHCHYRPQPPCNLSGLRTGT